MSKITNMKLSNFDQELLNYLNENLDTQFRDDNLARMFKVKTASMRMSLVRLNVEMAKIGKSTVYFIRSESEKKRIAEVLASKTVTRERPKFDNTAMRIAVSRCKEVYPNGGNFKSIS